MAHQSSGFMAVRIADLPKTPRAFQEYVKRYFRRTNWFGAPCFAAIITIGGMKFGEKVRGVAPSHSVELMGFGDIEVYPGGANSLLKWIEQEGAKKDGLIFDFDASWDDGQITCWED